MKARPNPSDQKHTSAGFQTETLPDLALEPFGWTERAAEWIALLAAQDTRRVYHRCDASGRHRPLRNGNVSKVVLGV